MKQRAQSKRYITKEEPVLHYALMIDSIAVFRVPGYLSSNTVSGHSLQARQSHPMSRKECLFSWLYNY